MKRIYTGLAYCLICLCCPAFGQIYINEILASNTDGIQDEAGDFEDWIELYNAGKETIDIGGWYLTDDLADLKKYRIPLSDPSKTSIPANGYLILWADKEPEEGILHMGIKLSADGESVGLSHEVDGELSIVDSLTFGSQIKNVSYGRGKKNAYHFFTTPTPGLPNQRVAKVEIASPVFSHHGGFYQRDLTLSLEAPKGLKIYYTIDGSRPDPQNLQGQSFEVKQTYPGKISQRQHKTHLYKEPLQIHPQQPEGSEWAYIETTTAQNKRLPEKEIFQATVVRAITYDPKTSAQSEVATHTYFCDEKMSVRYNLPIVSISTDADNLFGYRSGIYVPGQTWDSTRQHYNANNRGREWERKAHLEFFETDGTPALSQQIGVRIHGGSTRRAARKSLRLYARSEYDHQKTFSYDFFPGLSKKGKPNKPLSEFKRLILRQGGNNWWKNLYKEAMLHEIVADFPCETQASRPLVHFINGEFWGIMNLRERYDDEYFEAHYEVDKEEVVIIAYSGVLDTGIPEDEKHYTTMHDFIKQGDMKENELFEKAEKMIDMQNLIHFYLAQIYFNNSDWFFVNRKAWRKRTPFMPEAPMGHDGRYRWMLFDLDYGFLNPEENTLERVLEDKSKPTDMIRNLLENREFKTSFINAFADHMNSTFLSERLTTIIDSSRNRLATAIGEHEERWGNSSADIYYEELKGFANNRPEEMRNHLLSAFDISGTYKLSLNINNPKGGYIQVNAIDICPEGLTEFPFNWSGLYFRGIPIEIKAIPFPGYTFKKWEGERNHTSKNLQLSPNKDIKLSAYFVSETKN